MPKRRRFTLVLVPHNTKRVKEIGGPFVLLCGIILSFLIVLGVWSIGSTYVVSIFDGGKLANLERENRLLNVRIQELNLLTETVKQQMSQLVEREKAARVAVGLPDIHPDIRLVGAGGASDTPLDDDTPLELAQRLQEDLSRLLREAKLEVASLQSIENKAAQDQEYWRYIPTVKPVNGWISSPFGMRNDPFTGLRRLHPGIDIAARRGELVRSTADGVVSRTGLDVNYGRYVDIDHKNGYTTRYGHLSIIKTKRGATVKRGDLIGHVGNTGRANGYHVHYEVRRNGRLLDPAVYCFPESVSIN